MIKIYHNPRCRKSREGLQLLENSGKEFEVVRYLEDIPTLAELRIIVDSLNMAPEQLIRKNEAIWKEKFKGRVLSDDELLAAMVSYPKLIERPIVICNGKAAIGRPLENITTLLK
ncbi:arsenate reductase (glutaredoxin) [Maribacter chungangensis]|uniref:Arsenate reductase (Glutaredoxin) n=1 Tax=Maribacter chungangensis TaxID=1069117 RepID=A0ABW3B978_9FLAO